MVLVLFYALLLTFNRMAKVVDTELVETYRNNMWRVAMRIRKDNTDRARFSDQYKGVLAEV